MKALTPVDQLFLWLEKRQQPMHVGGLHILSCPEGASSRFVTDLAEFMRGFQNPNAPFNQRLYQKFGQYYWDEDQQFDLEHHYRHVALPKPGRIRELLGVVSANHSHLMDRERPMWSIHFIEGIRGKRFAFYIKAHHCMLDGVAAMRMVDKLYGEDPDARDMPPFWALPVHKRKRQTLHEGGDVLQGLAHLMEGAGKQIATIPTLAREITRAVVRARKNPNMSGLYRAPQSIINGRITGSRRFAAQSYKLDRFRAIASAMKGTLNDVVLAVCGSALRNYLISQQALPDSPLIAMVPMSIRKDDSDSGNQVAMILANLATHVADPTRRLEVIQSSVKDAKQMFRQMSQEEAINYTALTLAPTGLHLMTGLVPSWQAFNVVISNVPGPKKTRYWNGAKLEGLYPVSIPIDYVALNITLVSYEDQMEFGLTACRRTLPSMQRLLDYLEMGIQELEVAAGLR